jgi:hypothetical protein
MAAPAASRLSASTKKIGLRQLRKEARAGERQPRQPVMAQPHQLPAAAGWRRAMLSFDPLLGSTAKRGMPLAHQTRIVL